jgi:hypothetical protein
MTNTQLQTKLEKKGYKVTAFIENRNGEQTIVGYSIKNNTGRIIKLDKTLSKLLRTKLY